jgi:hypothetical protein
MPITDVAPKLGVNRLIYFEVEQFSTRAAALELYRGTMTGTLKVVEVSDGKGKLAYEENNVKIQFPRKAPEEGILGADEYKIYLGSVDRMTTEILYRFITHDTNEEEEAK